MKKETEKLSATEKVMLKTDSWIQKNAKKLIIAAIAIVVVVVVVAVSSLLVTKSTNDKFATLYTLEEHYNTLRAADKSAEGYADKVNTFVAEADLVSGKNKIDSFAGAKASLLKANVLFDEGKYQEAYDLYIAIANANSKEYFAPLCYMNAAAAAENMGNADDALELYTKVWDVYGKDAPEAPKALLGQARIIEANGDVELASSIYNQLADEFPSSYYAALAEAKLLVL